MSAISTRLEPGKTPGTWYAHDVTTQDNRPIWHSEVRAAAGPSTYITIALCRSQPYQRQDAEYIALACNAHAQLVEALAGLIALVAAAFPLTGAAITSEARAALSLARGETPC